MSALDSEHYICLSQVPETEMTDDGRMATDDGDSETSITCVPAHSEDEPDAITPLIDTESEGFRARCFTDTGVIIRRRRKNVKQSRITILLNDEFPLEGDIRKKLPSVRIRRLTTSMSMKDKRKHLRIIEEDEGIHRKPKPFWERYEDLKNRNRLSFINVASAMKQSTMERVETEARKWHKIKMRLKDLRQSVTLWEKSLKAIEGRFGMATMTYFRFVKWLMFLNFYIMIITFCAILIPYAALGPTQFDNFIKNKSTPSLQDNQTDHIESINATIISLNCTREYIRHIHEETGKKRGSAEVILDLLQGTGWMEESVFFYGTYNNRTYTSNGHHVVYNMGLAYLIVLTVSFLISFILIIRNSSKNMKASYGVEKSVAKFTNKVFGGWDFCVCEQKNADSKHKIIGIELTADLAEQRRQKKLKEMKWIERLEVYGMRIVINVLVVIILIGSLALIGFTTERMINAIDLPLSNAGRLFYQYIPYIAITALNLVVPRIFEKMVEFEDYTHEFGIRMTLSRCILLRLSSPIALMVILYVQLIAGSDGEKQCGNKRWSHVRSSGVVKCWETYVGQQIYKLVLIDSFAVILVVFLWHFPRNYINKKYRDKSKIVKMIGPQQFNLPKSVVDVVYAQNLCWFGLLFCPLISAVTFLHTVLVFYMKKFTLFQNCHSESQPVKTSRSNSLFMKELLLSFIFAVVPIGYIISNIQPSQSCGPFRLYTGEEYMMYSALISHVYSLNTIAQTVFFSFGTGLFAVPVFILLVLVMYYYWVIGRGFSSKEESIKVDLKWEKEDKKFLLKQINKQKELIRINESAC